MELIEKLRDTAHTNVIKKHCHINQPVILQQYPNATLAVLISIRKILGFISVAPKVIGFIPDRTAKRMIKLLATGETFSGKIKYLRTHHVSRDWNDDYDYDDDWDDYHPVVSITFISLG